ncbi:DUF6261 family protein [Flavobacterium sp.]|uniref:DUF6261 family protein n=1 Tax=Flavobacterium sp. TaxID=239 RepID=UPI00286DD05D|nr:DUF6261 family protein [Flavobacterium sp.]
MNGIDLPKLRNAEYLQFIKNYLAIVLRNDPTVLKILAKYDALVGKGNELDALFKKILANEKTAEILALDERRDDAVNGIYYVAQGYDYHFDPTLKSAGTLIKESFSVYGGGISRLNYQAETATITSLIMDWENKAPLVGAFTTLNLTAWKNELKAANIAFDEKFLDRTQEYGDATPENLKSKREETNVVYYALRDRIDAYHLLAETTPSPYTTVINQLNALIDQYNSLLNNRAPEVPPTA